MAAHQRGTETPRSLQLTELMRNAILQSPSPADPQNAAVYVWQGNN